MLEPDAEMPEWIHEGQQQILADGEGHDRNSGASSEWMMSMGPCLKMISSSSVSASYSKPYDGSHAGDPRGPS